MKALIALKKGSRTQCQILRSTNQLTAAVEVGEGDVMLEIRLRTGSLTNVLINAGAFVLAIKKHPHMATHVSERFAETDRFKVKPYFYHISICPMLLRNELFSGILDNWKLSFERGLCQMSHSLTCGVVVGMCRAIGLTATIFHDSIFPFF
ncbi:hypothetical protein DVH24_008784 [Malus domestica]|uniref:Uncharacterized protein n=1 Tax=Malus domestica TaxID=3750 RepID=A0A498JL26_MALDO|nr:hypothetical protein DVH24_008784 [Malus domestica]